MSNPPLPTPTLGKILFAEDDDLFRLSLGELLGRAGFEFDCATSGPEVIEKLKTGDYEALLSDINMPGTTGLKLVESVGAMAQPLPIILLTGSPTVETATRSVRLRVFAYLVKPPDIADLCQVLTAAIAQQRDMRMLRDNRRWLQDWEREIERIQRLLLQPVPSNRSAPMQNYLRVTLRNLVVGLVELEHLLLQKGDTLGTDSLLEKQELTQAMRKTIGVLQKTRDHFKSRDLAELRKELETLIR